MIASFDPFPLLTTQRLFLRKVLAEDINEIFFLRSDKKVLQYIDTEPAASLIETYQFIEKITGLEKNNECVSWAMVPRGEKYLIGTICFWNLEKENNKAEVGYSMHPDYYGQGLMQEAMSAILSYGFTEMQLKLVEAITNKDNVRSRQLLERNNFTRDAQLEKEKIGMEEPDYAVIYTIRK